MTGIEKTINQNKMDTSIIGVFAEEEDLVSAAKNVKNEGFSIREVYTPYPIHEIIEVQGETSKLTVAAYLYGLFGGIAVLAFLYYTSVISWPLNYGGKPFNAFPSFIVVTLVLIIFLVTILSLFTFSVRASLWPGKKEIIVDQRATDDKFILVIRKDEKELEKIHNILNKNGAEEVYEK
jgi:hypothetical protein